MYDDKEDKKLELIGQRFKFWHPAAAALIEKEYDVKTEKLLGQYVYDFFPKKYEDLEKETKPELEAWIEDEEERMDMIDPPYRRDDPADYLRREI